MAAVASLRRSIPSHDVVVPPSSSSSSSSSSAAAANNHHHNSSISTSATASADIVIRQEPQQDQSPLTSNARPRHTPSPTGSHPQPPNQSTQSRSEHKNIKTLNSVQFADDSTAAGVADAQPLAPPPRPVPNSNLDQGDRPAPNKNHFNLEPNPFEQSFGNQSSSEAQSKQLLPPVASLTSPSSLLPGSTPGWSNSLRSGPLSPAMLAGPAGGDYFSDSHFRTSFPTPNESSLRTGLTPGGGGSMFPAPSPNGAAAAAAAGGATPNTLDFHRTALSAAAAAAAAVAKPPAFNLRRNAPVGSRASEGSQLVSSADQSSHQPSGVPQTNSVPSSNDPFAQHDTDAANGLYMLANANGSRNNSHFTMPSQPGAQAANANAAGSAAGDRRISNSMGDVMNDQSSTQGRRSAKNSIVSMSGSANGTSEPGDYSGSERSEQEKPAPARSRSKKASHVKTASVATTSSDAMNSVVDGASASRRKGDDISSKAPPIKRSRKSTGSINNKFTAMAAAATADDMMGDMDESDDEDGSMMDIRQESGNKKMTDEEKRKNFLERNRVAALKCRQRKKQWLANLQAKVELFSTENDALTAQVTQMREEIVNLKTLLIAHKDCTVSQAQGLSGLAMQSFLGDVAHHANPFGSLGMHHRNGGHAMGGGESNGGDPRTISGGMQR